MLHYLESGASTALCGAPAPIHRTDDWQRVTCPRCYDGYGDAPTLVNTHPTDPRSVLAMNDTPAPAHPAPIHHGGYIEYDDEKWWAGHLLTAAEQQRDSARALLAECVEALEESASEPCRNPRPFPPCSQRPGHEPCTPCGHRALLARVRGR